MLHRYTSSPSKKFMWFQVAPKKVGGDLYRVAIHRPDEDTFEVYVAEKFSRRFTLSTMPGKLRSILAVIHTYDWKALGKDFYVPPLQSTLYAPEYLLEVGWMTSPVDYCVLLEKNFIDELKGVSVSQDTLTKDEVKE